jgi:hypothetical protein
MTIWHLMMYLAWILSVILIAWMFIDCLKTNKGYKEDFLLSSREGHDEIAEQERAFAEQRAATKKNG